MARGLISTEAKSQSVEAKKTSLRTENKPRLLRFIERSNFSNQEKDNQLAAFSRVTAEGNKYLNQYLAGDPATRRAMVDNEAQNELGTFALLVRNANASGNKFRQLDFSQAQPKTAINLSFRITDGKPNSPTLSVGPQETGMQQLKIQTISGRSPNGENFICSVTAPDNHTHQVEIPANLIITQAFITTYEGSAEVQKVFKDADGKPTADSKVIEAAVKTLKGETVDPANQPTEAEIKEVAVKSGQVSADAVKTFIGKTREAMKENSDPEIEKVFQEISNNLNGRLIAEPEIITKLFGPDIAGGQLTTMYNQARKISALYRQKLIPLQQSLTKDNKETVGKKITEYEELIHEADLQTEAVHMLYHSLVELGENPVLDVFTAVQNGTQDTGVINTLNEGLSDGDPTAFFAHIIDGLDPKLVPEKTKLQKVLESVDKKKGWAAIISGLGMFFLIKKAMQEGKLGAVGPPGAPTE